MTPFTTLSQAIETALSTMPQMAGVGIVQEDTEDIATEVAKATGEIGLLVLLGIPRFANLDAKLSNVVNAKLEIEILIREVPLIWRMGANENPVHCSDLAQAMAPVLQGLVIPGFEPLRVMSGESTGNWARRKDDGEPVIFQDYVIALETMQIFETS